ncbi:MAG: alpha/beta hydrolase family protein, partial [Spirochaetota bacterium]
MGYVKRFLCPGLSAVLLLFCACSSSSSQSGDRAASPLPGKNGILKSAGAASAVYDYTYKECVYISSPGETEAASIAANVFVPVTQSENETFPAIIFCNSWVLDEHEYVVQAIHYVKKGYIVISYSARGWGLSGGQVALGSGNERADFRSVVDWLIDNTPVDADNIGVCGISLGGGNALASLAHDDRINTAVGISAWTDLETHMFSESTPRMVWGSILVVTGAIVADMDPDIYSIFGATLSNTNITWLKEWCGVRSTINYMDEINRRNKPVYIANNMEDYLFAPDSVLAFFNALTVDHKRADLSLGTHFSGEATGLFGLPNYVFGNVEDWFDYWLKGIDTGIITDQARSAVVTMEEKNYLERKVYDTASLNKSDGSFTWPPDSVSNQTFYLSPRGLFTNGGIKTAENTKNTENSFYSGLLSGATAGAAVFPILEQLGVSV